MSVNIPFKFDQSVEPSNLKNISTEILKPVSIDDNQATFVLRNTGYLDRKTRLTLSAVAVPVVAGETTNDVAGVSYPMSCGASSLIRSAVLKVSGKVIAQNNAVADVIAMKANFEDVEGRNNILRARLGIHNSWTHSRRGTNNAFETNYNTAGQAQLDANAAYIGGTPDKQGKIVPDNINWTPSADHTEECVSTAFQGSNYGLTSNADTTMKAYISLEELFPWLYTAVGREVLQLPLMFINEEIQLVIQFNKNGSTPINNYRGLNNAEHLGKGFKVNILTDECNLLIDYLHFFDNSATAKEIMGDGLVLNYADLEMINLSMTGLSSTTAIRNKKKENYNLGLVGKTIRQMYIVNKPSVQIEENSGILAVGQDIFGALDGGSNPTNAANGNDISAFAYPISDNSDPIKCRVVVAGNTITNIFVVRSPAKVAVGEVFRIPASQVPQAGGAASNQTPEITLRNNDVTVPAHTNRGYQKQNRLNGRFCSKALSNFTDGVSYQVNINGKNLYVNPVNTNQEQLMRLSSAWGNAFQNPMSQYCLWDSVVDDLDADYAKKGNNVDRVEGERFDLKSIISSTARINGHLLTDLHGCSQYFGIDLQKLVMSQNGNVQRMDLQGSGTEVVNAPIFLEIERDIPQNQNNDNREVLVVCLVEKAIVMKNGSVSIL